MSGIFDLREACAERMLCVAHRGTCGGNLPCNTMEAYELALSHGADMLEIDVDRTRDGRLVIFHPGKERELLGFSGSIRNYDWSFVRQLRYTNMDRDETQFGLSLFDDVLERFKDRCFINVDKFWDNPREISDAIRAHGMTEQILVKTGPDERLWKILEEYAHDIQYMGIFWNPDQLAAARARKLRYVGTEVLFDKESSPFSTREFVEAQHRQGLLVWLNTIVYSYRAVLAAGHNDDCSVCGNPENGWGWCFDRGYDLMQTDWVLAARTFLAATGRTHRDRAHSAAAFAR